ncbi:MAG: EAL domain-containing protein [Arcobacteraceae bacterium]|nr:EAL domain-containing protein [Arcobacteraceae bacterium]
MNSTAVNLKDVTVLYCEDEDDLRTVTGDVIQQFTKKVFLAEDGKVGLELFKKYADEIDLIITDVNMPEMNGLEMAKEIKAINYNIPIIVATAFSNSSYLLEAIELGIDKYVLKPIDIKKLFTVMKQSLLYHELQDLYRDNFTRLPNRNALIKQLKQESPSILALIDIDDFSTLNELYSEAVGDEILLAFKEMLEESFPKDEYGIYRVGADKFAILAKNSDMLQNELKVKCENFIQIVDTNGATIDNNTINFAITVAIAKTNNHKTYETVQRVLGMAKSKFVQILEYDKDTHDTHKNFEENMIWIKKLKEGLTDGHFKAHFQAIVHSSTQEIYKYESLIRYIEDDGEVISPYRFLPIAKKAKLFNGIIKLMITECLNFIRGKNTTVAVNISFDDIKNKDIYAYIINLLEENKDITHQLHFELLETEEIEDFEMVRKFIDDVHKYGCQVGVDDFGAGYSNFNMIEALQVDFIKIDGSLINSVDVDETQAIIVDTIAGYAKRTGIKTVAEFVSKESIYTKIHELGIDFAQGYYFGKPISYVEVP